MKKLLFGSVLSVLLLLTACSTHRTASVPVPVKVPFVAPCQVVTPTKPQWPLDDPEIQNKDVFQKVVAALAEIEMRISYELKLEAALEACK